MKKFSMDIKHTTLLWLRYIYIKYIYIYNVVKCRVQNFLFFFFSHWEARSKLPRNVLNLPRALMALGYPEMGFSLIRHLLLHLEKNPKA